MYKITAGEIAEIVKGKLTEGNPETQINGFSIDSRNSKQGDLFLPLKGERTDGHTFIKEAIEKGASGYLYSSGNPVKGAFGIKVDDVLQSLQELASKRRDDFNGKVISVTGSTGKTTVKDFLVSVLSKDYKVFASPKNYNTDIGLPLALMLFPDDCQVLILEMGMRGKGQIEELTKIAKPDYGLITNVSKTHIELLGSEENIALAKGELLDSLNKEKTVFLNSCDKWTPFYKKSSKCNIKTFGLSDDEVVAENINFDEMARTSFDILFGGQRERVNLNIPGEHNVINALAATSVGLAMGISLEKIADALSNAKSSDWRMEVKEQGKILIISDYYNASPQSMEAALDTLSKIDNGRKVAILGDMLELGDFSLDEHIRILNKAKESADLILLVGKYMEKAAKSEPLSACIYNSVSSLVKEIDKLIKPGDVVLLKASRAMAFEKIEQGLLGGRIAD